VLLFPSGPDYVAAFFGCLYAGVIAVPAYPPGLPVSTTRNGCCRSSTTPSRACC
jgi:acyl-CoA synthetase (AMP-forming)/AMP-acid ligase II